MCQNIYNDIWLHTPYQARSGHIIAQVVMTSNACSPVVKEKDLYSRNRQRKRRYRCEHPAQGPRTGLLYVGLPCCSARQSCSSAQLSYLLKIKLLVVKWEIIRPRWLLIRYVCLSRIYFIGILFHIQYLLFFVPIKSLGLFVILWTNVHNVCSYSSRTSIPKHCTTTFSTLPRLATTVSRTKTISGYTSRSNGKVKCVGITML